MQNIEEDCAQTESANRDERFDVLLLVSGLRKASEPDSGEDGVAYGDMLVLSAAQQQEGVPYPFAFPQSNSTR